jgi:hypothetical protein
MAKAARVEAAKIEDDAAEVAVDTAFVEAQIKLAGLADIGKGTCSAQLETMLNDIIKGLKSSYALLFGENNDLYQGNQDWNDATEKMMSEIEANVTSSATS